MRFMRIVNERNSFILLAILVTLVLGLAFIGCSSDEEVSDDVSDQTIEPVDTTTVSTDTTGTDSGEEEEDEGEEEEEEEEEGFVEEEDDDADDVTGTFDYSVLSSLGHPRLLLTEDEFAELKTKVTTYKAKNPYLYKLHTYTINLAEDALTNESPVSSTNTLSASKNILKRLFSLAYAYRITGRSKYLEQAEADITTVCGYSNWHTNWLRRSEINLGIALAYDWLYYDLSYDTRALAHKRMVGYALRSSLSGSFHDMDGNWNQVCNNSMVAAALTLYEKDKEVCAKVIEAALESNQSCLTNTYSPDGEYWQGSGYWSYGTSCEAIMLQNLMMCFGNAGGLEDTEGFAETAEYIVFMRGATDKTFNYADGGSNGTAEGRTASWWFAQWLDNPDLLLNEVDLIDAGSFTGSVDDRLLPATVSFAYRSDFESSTISPPTKNIWYGSGKADVCMIHTGWNFDTGDYYVGIKGGKSYLGHSHMDAGSFVFESNGVRWSYDLGRQSYDSLESLLSSAGGDLSSLVQTSLRWDVYCLNNLGHSTLAFEACDGSVTKLHDTDQLVDGYASIVEAYEEDDNLGVKLDLSDTYADQVSSLYRTVRLVDEKDLYVIDEVTAKDDLDAPMQWRMMTGATVTVNDANIRLKSGTKYLYIKASNTADLDITYTSWEPSRPDSWTSRTWDDDNDGYTVVGYTATIPAGSSATFTTILSASN